jgi:hypothetical protein
MYVLICAHLYVWKTIGCDTYTINRNRLDTLRRPCGACTGSSDQVVGNNQLLCLNERTTMCTSMKFNQNRSELSHRIHECVTV